MPLRFNEKEMLSLCRNQLPGDIEGRLLYGPPEAYSESKSQAFKERWFKLCGNLLFSFKLNEHGGVNKNAEPNGLIIVEDCIVQMEGFESVLFAFSITFSGGSGRRKHVFGCFSVEQAQKWTRQLRRSSVGTWTAQALELEARIKALGAKPNFEVTKDNFPMGIPRTGSLPTLNCPSPPPRSKETNQKDSSKHGASKFYCEPDPTAGQKSKSSFLSSPLLPVRRSTSSKSGKAAPSFKSHVASAPSFVAPAPPEKPRPPKPVRPPPPVPKPQEEESSKDLIQF